MVNFKRNSANFLMLSAIRLGDIADVRAALDKGADPNLDLKEKPLPLELAVKRGFSDIVYLLLDRGADPEPLFDDSDRTPCILNVLEDGNYGLVKTLLVATGRKIKIDWHKYSGHVLPLSQDVDIAALLKKAGSPLPAPNSKSAGKALIIAAKLGNLELVQSIIKSKPKTLEYVEDGLGTALHAAVNFVRRASRGGVYLKILETLLDAGANIEAHDEENDIFTPLWDSMDANDDITTLLLDRGANIHYRHPDDGSEFAGWTVLHLAIYYSRGKTALLLLNRGAAIDLPGLDDTSPLHMALRYKLPDVCRELIARGADVHSPMGYSKETPLHAAVGSGMVELVGVLLQAGAKGAERNRDGKTPLDLAKEHNNEAIVARLSV